MIRIIDHHDRDLYERDEGVEDAASGSPGDRAGRCLRRSGLLAERDIERPGATTGPVSSTPAGSAAAEAVTLNLWIFEGEEEFLPKVKEAFEDVAPGHESGDHDLPEDQYTTKIDTALAAAIAARYRVHVRPALHQGGSHGADRRCAHRARSRSDALRAGSTFGLHPRREALLHRDLYGRARAHVQQGRSSTRRYPVPFVHGTSMSVDEYAAIAKKLTDRERRPCQDACGVARPARPYWWMDHADLIGYGRADRGRGTGRRRDDPHLGPLPLEWFGMGTRHERMTQGHVDGGREILLATGQQRDVHRGQLQPRRSLLEQGIDVGVAPLPVE